MSDCHRIDMFGLFYLLVTTDLYTDCLKVLHHVWCDMMLWLEMVYNDNINDPQPSTQVYVISRYTNLYYMCTLCKILYLLEITSRSFFKKQIFKFSLRAV